MKLKNIIKLKIQKKGEERQEDACSKHPEAC